MLEGAWHKSIQDGDEGDKRLVGGRGHHRLVGGTSDDLLERRSACLEGTGARLSRLLHASVPSASRGWRKAVCALAAALPLLLGAGGVAAQDAQDTLPTVSVSDVQVSEGRSWIVFEVSLSQPSRERVTVDFATSGGTATSGTDYRAESEKLTFPANSRGSVRVPVLVYDDQDLEPDETFTVTLTNPVGATLGDATATGTIRDDDTAATLAANDIEDTTATLTISGHTDGWWYKGNGWQGNVHPCTAVAAGTTAVNIDGLTAARGYEYSAYSDSVCDTRLAKVSFRTLAPEGTPTVSISDAEVSEDGTWMEFKVSLSQPSRKPVTVRFETSGGTATSGVDFEDLSGLWAGHVLFGANSSTTTRSADVIVYDDQDPEPDETFTVTLTSARNATLGDATATGTIRDDGDTRGEQHRGNDGDADHQRPHGQLVVQGQKVGNLAVGSLHGGRRRRDGGEHRRSLGVNGLRVLGLQRQRLQHETGQHGVRDPCAGGSAHGERVRRGDFRGRSVDGIQGVAVASEP